MKKAATGYHHYDQLNRLVKMNAFKGLNTQTNSWTPIALDDYQEALSYDANGNILTYKRNGSGGNVNLNNYSYTYQNGSNRLIALKNAVDNKTSAYGYDAIGNVTKDEKQDVVKNTWNVYGKLQKVEKKDGKIITYSYDASGNRISKLVGDTTEIYVRDAGGNVLLTYQQNRLVNSGHISIKEFYKYGSSLLGIKKRVVDVSDLKDAPTIENDITGEDEYYLYDHRGNVIGSVSDKKLQVDDNNDGLVDSYLPEVKTATLYSTYGAMAKSFNGDSIILGFNGQRISREISPTAQTAEFWEYNADVGRRWNLDPVNKPWESPYATFNNNPIFKIDPAGLDGTPYKIKKGDNLSKIAKRFGTSVAKLMEINDIKDANKISAGQVIQLYAYTSPKEAEIFGNPEQDFKSSPLTGYNNPKNDQYSYSVTATSIELGRSFISNDGRIPYTQNTVIIGGPLLNEVKNLPSVQKLINRGLNELYKDKKLEPGEYFKSSYEMSDITSDDGQRIFKQAFKDIFTRKLTNNKFFSAENFIGSYGFSMRVSGDGKEMVICVYDSKSIGSLADHRAWIEKRLPNLTPTYQRYLWRLPIVNEKK